MKELSTEQKAKRYDEVIKLVNSKWHYKNQPCIIDASDIFPELKESEDEKMRKGLIRQFTRLSSSSDMWGGIKIEDILAWLEKQGEHRQDANYPKFNLDDVLALQYCMETVKKVQEDKDLYEKLEDLHGRIYDAYQLEKQNDNAGKVEQRFKVGDWVVFKNNHQSVYQVEKIDDGYYILRHTHGGRFRVCVLHDEGLKLWTIEDAKDGDVLLFEGYYNSIVLFQGIGINGIGRINYHCQCFLSNYSIGIQGDIACLGTVEKDAQNYHPATKEQRDLLFQKMKEKGYGWNVDKKELIKL